MTERERIELLLEEAEIVDWLELSERDVLAWLELSGESPDDAEPEEVA